MNRREFLTIGAGAAAAACFGSPLLSSCSREIDTLKLGYIPITDAAPLLAAHALGFFQEEGLKVERPRMIRTWSSLVEAFLSGKINVTHLLLPIPIWMRYNTGAPVKVIAWDHTNGSALTIGRDSGIRSFSDLGGTQVAVPFWYSMHNVILQLGLRERGLKPVIRSQEAPLRPDEVNLLVLPPPEMPAALASKKIDAYIVAEPFNALAEERTGASILRFTGDIWKNHPCCVVVMKEREINSNPIFTQGVVNAVVRAQDWLRQNPLRAADILSQEGENYLPVARTVLERVFVGYELDRYGPGNLPQAIQHPEWELKRIDFQPYPYPSATELIYRRLQETVVEGDTGFLSKQSGAFVARDLAETQFVKQALRETGARFPDLDINAPLTREEVIEL